MSAGENAPLVTPGTLGRAALRGVLVGVATCVSVSACFVWANEGLDAPLLAGLTFLPGLAAAPLALVERAAVRRAPSLRRDVVFGLLAWTVGFLGVALALLQLVYLTKIGNHGSSLEPAAVGRFFAWLLKTLKLRELLFLVALAAPAAPTLVARVRGVRRWRRLVLVPLASVLLAAGPAAPTLLQEWRPGLLVACVVAGAVLLPVVLELADGIEARLLPPPEAESADAVSPSWAAGGPRVPPDAG